MKSLIQEEEKVREVGGLHVIKMRGMNQEELIINLEVEQGEGDLGSTRFFYL